LNFSPIWPILKLKFDVVSLEQGMSWKELLESAKESLNDHLQLRNEYLMAEKHILRNQIEGRVQLTDSERKELAEIGAKLGKKALAEIATVAQPETILAWNRKFTTQKVDPCERPKSVGRRRVDQEIENWVIRMARENRSWGYDRIQGSLKHLGYPISDQTVGNILKRHGISPAPERKKTVTWREFVRSHLDVLLATDFFNRDVRSWFELLIPFLFYFIYFSRDQIYAVGTTLHQQMQSMHFFGRRTLDRRAGVASWAPWSGQLSRSPAIRCREGSRRPTVSEISTHDDRAPIPHIRTKVVPLPSGNSCQIRDGPMQQRLDELLINNKCKAA
jgi:transposase